MLSTSPAGKKQQHKKSIRFQEFIISVNPKSVCREYNRFGIFFLPPSLYLSNVIIRFTLSWHSSLSDKLYKIRFIPYICSPVKLCMQ